ncbi:MAG: hypothetical protein L0215_07400 [Gemmataceae bacterium]|nr:hypothetical protein [Gemmataceae bacterium]
MPGRGFLQVAKDVVAGPTEFHWRAAAVHAYYAVFLECRDALLGWGCTLPSGVNVHAWTRLKLVYAKVADLKLLGDYMDRLVISRNKASYDLHSHLFVNRVLAQTRIQEADDALKLLDQIQADPSRRQAVIAALPP